MGKWYLFNVYTFCKSLCVINVVSPYYMGCPYIFCIYMTKCGWLGTHKSFVLNNNQHFTTTTLKFWLAKCSISISYICRHATGTRQLAPAQQDRATEPRNQQLWQVTQIWEQGLRAQQYIILRRSQSQVTKVPGQTPHIAAEYSAASRNRTPWARISLNIRKPKSQARVKF